MLILSTCHKCFLTIFSVTVFFVMISGMAEAQKKKRSDKDDRKRVGIILASEKSSFYRIVLPASPTLWEEKAARVLKDYVMQISGAALPIVTADQPVYEFEIVLGQNERLNDVEMSVPFDSLDADGFVLATEGTRLVIAGGYKKGTLYGVYTFLEKYMDCRMYSPTVKVIPKKTTVELPEIYDLQVPVIRFRDTHYRVTWHEEYTDWHKLDHDDKGNRPDWGMWVHTFHNLVPPDTYASDHPEYYALVDGKRIPTQLCLSHPDVLKIVIQNLKREIAKNPDATYWSVSQNDNRRYCTCASCAAIDEREGSPSGSMINFVNQVAVHFPDKMISTLAYEYTRKAPENLKPADNVNIMLCSIEAFRDKPIADDSTSLDFQRDVVEWGKIAKDIIVWDYVIQFTNLVSPFPNLHVLQPNIQFFANNGVNAMFEQGNREVGGEFAELRAYMISKLLWDPFQDADFLMNDFLHGYYGPAAPYLRQYIDAMRTALLSSGQPLRIFGSPIDAESSYLSPELIAKYEALFDQAESEVSEEPELLERVRIARLPLEFAIIEQAKNHYTGERGLFVLKDGKWLPRLEIQRRVDPFVDLCIRQGVTQVKEWSTSPEAYRSAMYRLYAQGMKEHLAYKKPVRFIRPAVETLPPNAAEIITDGKRGSHDYAYNWLVFAGEDLDVVVDLGTIKEVRRIETSYFQYAYWLRILPAKVEYAVSLDGENFEPVAVIPNTLPIDQYGGQQRDFIGEFSPRNARYIRVTARTIGNTPEWHPGSGQPARMLVDEIVVE